ncbi:MAG: exonuclease domain-containing protein [Gulosibacter sp.]|uniref:exonuclease domain-containing protein n=1 Tax=Gulosibacter sp. TaxID=2817531 RepID=UPI003F925E73
MSFAVLDLETTGFSPSRGDRIVEVGVVLLDDQGGVEQEWTTLVNPQRDIGATHVHGIRARDVVDAPVFGDIAPDLVELLAGRTLVAHNQAFDVRFLRAEFEPHGHAMADDYAALCTMVWSRRTFGATKLVDVCAALGIDLIDAHSALGDAKATSQVLTRLLGTANGDRDWQQDVARGVFPSVRVTAHPTAALSARVADPNAAVSSQDQPLWQRVTVPLPTDDLGASVYLELLTDVLDDGLISSGEHSQLASLAEVARLDDGRLPKLHRTYLDAVAAEAVADGTVTDDEQNQLAQISTILDLTLPDLGSMLTAVSSRSRAQLVGRPEHPDERIASTGANFQLTPGCRVVFTGAMSIPREEWAQHLVEAGLTTGAVTKKTAVLVAEDPATQSGKARNAAKYGIPVVTEAEFAPVFDAYVANSRA